MSGRRRTTKDVLLTPSLAQRLLANNSGNRPLRPSTVKHYCEQIRRGEFLHTHQGLAVDWNGVLQDGQHRCMAVIETGIPVMVQITYNVDPKNFAVVDRGAGRSVADVLRRPQREAEIIAMAARIGTGQSKPTHGQLQAFEDALGPTIEELMGHAGSKKTKFSTAPIKLAAVTSILQGQPKEHVLDIYRNLTLSKIEALPPVANALVKQELQGRLTHKKNDYDMLARGMIVFDKKSARTTRVQVKDPQVTVDQVRSFLRDLVPSACAAS